MTKRLYLKRLRKALKGVPESEKDALIEYYSELIEESYDHGKSTYEIFSSLESPERVAANYKNADDGERERPKPEKYERERDREREREERDEKPRKRVPTLLVVLLFPIWLPLLIVGIVLAFTVSVLFLVLIVADVAVVVALFAAGLYCLAMSIGLIPSNGLIAVSQIGAGIALIGISLLFGTTIAPLGRGIGALFRLVFRVKRDGSAAVKPVYSIRTLAVALSFLFLGAGVGAIGFGNLGWDWERLADVGDYVLQEQELKLESDTLTVDADNLALTVCPAVDQAKFVYYTNPELQRTVSYENNTLSVTDGIWNTGAKTYLQNAWKRGVMFSAIATKYSKATLYLPADYTGGLTVEVSNGVLNLGGVTLSSVQLKTSNGVVTVEDCTLDALSVTTQNGAVKLGGVTVGKLCTVKTNNGAVSVTDVTCAEGVFSVDNGAVDLDQITADSVTAETNNGGVNFSKVLATQLRFTTDNGSVWGTLEGKRSDYKITASTGNGSCNLLNTDAGERILYVRTDNGSVDVDFAE